MQTFQTLPIPQKPFPRQFSPGQLHFLGQQAFSKGLIRSASALADCVSLRIWVIDNSTSMRTGDGHRVVIASGGIGLANCTRWQDVQESVSYHSQMAGILGFPTRFVMLNEPSKYVGPQSFSVGERGPSTIQQEVQFSIDTIKRSEPSGATPLTSHLLRIHQFVSSIAPQLRQQGKTVSVIIATDGFPSDENGNEGHIINAEFVRALKALEALPVSILVKLCTGDEKVVDFYNTLDMNLNLPYDVVDGYFGEALEVFLRNPWLNYALPLHRFRENGFRVGVLDKIDERGLSHGELHEFCMFLLAGDDGVRLPNPASDWDSFVAALSKIMATERQQWNPITKKFAPWIDVNKLNAAFGRGRMTHQQMPNFSFQPQQTPLGQGHWAQAHPQPPPPPPPGPVFGAQPHPSPFPASQQTASQSFFQPQANPPPGPKTATASQYHQPPKSEFPNTSHQSQPPPSFGNANDHATPQKNGNGSHPGANIASDDTLAALKRNILVTWALQPPNYQAPRPIEQLLVSVQISFPPAFGVENHSYFSKWKPISPGAFDSNEVRVLQKAVRKIKFFLHPDKLPKDLSPKQSLLCKILWDIIADAWEAHESSS